MRRAPSAPLRPRQRGRQDHRHLRPSPGLVNRGAGPVAFKCGPDYIDPMFHSEIIGAKAATWTSSSWAGTPPATCWRKTAGAAAWPSSRGSWATMTASALSADASAYDLARATGTPAVLVLDGRGRALTAAAAVKGMRDFRPDSGIRGVILNRVSPMLYPRLKEAIEGETGVTVYGYLPNLPGCALESRPPGAGHRRRGGGAAGEALRPGPPRRRKAWT